jgi:hypothetical protein
VDAANMGYNSGLVAGGRGDDPPAANTGNAAWDNAFNSAVATGFAVGESIAQGGLGLTAEQALAAGAGFYDAYYSSINSPGNPSSPNAPLSTSPEWGAYWSGWQEGLVASPTFGVPTTPATLEVTPVDPLEIDLTLEMTFDNPQDAFAAGFALGEDLAAYGVADLDSNIGANTGDPAQDAAFDAGMAEGDGTCATGCSSCSSCASCGSCSSCSSCSSCGSCS